MINDPITKVMQDASEIVRYDEVGIPLYIREGLLSSYPDHRALCHWHEDIEWVQIRSGQMNYYINGKRVLLNAGEAIIVNSRQMHYGYSEYIGLGEGMEDLQVFRKKEFVDSLFGENA